MSRKNLSLTGRFYNGFTITLVITALAVTALSVTACSPSDQAGDAEKHSAAANNAAVADASSALPAGIKLVESHSPKDGDYSIAYKKYEMDNGLTVVLHEDHSDPLAHVDVTFHVGSAREEVGRSGFAHFFEHMMFEGSQNVGRGEFSKFITDAGGTLNGTTNSDRTNYYETVPINQLETALWLEADRMGLLLEAVTQEQFDIQRAAVKNERGQRVDNRPYGRVSETMMQNLYPPGHPYSWPVIGWLEDLDAASLDDLKRFFLRWYGPNNATITIGGDINVEQTLQWISKYFGPIPRGPEVESQPKQPGSLEQDRYVTLEDNIHLPAIAMVIPTVYYRHQDEAPLDAAAKIMGQGRASLLYQRLVQTGRAVSASFSHGCRELACEMSMVVIQNPAAGESLADMEQAIRDTLAEFAERGVTDDDLQKFKAGFESGQIFGLQSVAGKVSQLAYAEVFTGTPDTANSDLQRYLDVDKGSVMETFREHVLNQPALILSIVPDGQPQLAAREANFNYQVDFDAVVQARPSVSPMDGAVPPKPPVWTDTFDRSARPQATVNPLVKLPPVTDLELDNGVRLLMVPNTETPTVTINAIFAMGQRDEPVGKAGLASLTSAMMNEATETRSAAEFSEALERIGAQLSVGSGQYETTLTLNVLSKHLDEGIELMMERLLQPAFLAEDFERLVSQQRQAIMQSMKSGGALASRALNSVLMDAANPFSVPASGTLESLDALTLEDVNSFYQAHLPERMVGVLTSSSEPATRIQAALSALGNIEETAPSRAPISGLADVDGRTIYLVHKPEAAQSTLRVAHPSITIDPLGKSYLASLMNFPLGGTFDSRINLNLREDKGYTYGIYTGFYAGRELGTFRVTSEINRDATHKALQEIFSELERYAADGMTEDEYNYLQNAIGQRDALRYETPGAKLGLIASILRYDLPLDYRSQQQQMLRETSREKLNSLAADLLRPEDLAIVIVGDLTVIRDELEGLGLPLVELDENGQTVSRD